MDIRVTGEVFDFAREAQGFSNRLSASGAVVTFSGIVRDNAEGALERMEIEHYPGMTEKALAGIAEQACGRWALEDVLVIHRHGAMRVGETIMMVATASKHRADAFEAAEFLMDYLKSRAPFWKKEVTSGEGGEWVDAREADEAALDRWNR